MYMLLHDCREEFRSLVFLDRSTRLQVFKKKGFASGIDFTKDLNTKMEQQSYISHQFFLACF